MSLVNKFIIVLVLILNLLSILGYLMLCENVIDESELEYFAQVVEAESDRSSGCTEGKVYVACCIWDRVNSTYFPSTVRGVLNEPGQFTTTSGGQCWTKATTGSRMAVVVSYIMLKYGYLPTNLLYFNCIGYQYGSAYGKFGDNYFSTYGKEVEFNVKGESIYEQR